LQASFDRESKADGNNIRWSNVRVLPAVERDAGDWSRDAGFAVTADADGQTMDVVVTFTWTLTGRVGGSFSHMTVGTGEDALDDATVDALRALFVERLRDAAESLAD